MGEVHIIDHPLVTHKMTHMRKKQTSTGKFRALVQEVSMLLAYEVTRDFPLSPIPIETPLEPMTAQVLDGKKIVFVSILRAGNGILDGMLRILPGARVGHVGIYRDPTEVINHYRASWRHPQLAWQVLRAWTHYNEGMLDAVANAGHDGILIRYDTLMTGDAELLRLESFLGREISDMREPGRYRARAQHPLYRVTDLLMKAVAPTSPSAVLMRLDARRSKQIDEAC